MNEITGGTIEWRDIKGYESLYQISNTGEIRSVDRKVIVGKYKRSHRIIKGKKLKLDSSKNKYGHCMVHLWKNNKRKAYLVHRLVAQSFLGKIDGMLVCHKDDMPANNHVDNLFIGTAKDNSQDAKRKGRTTYGEKNRQAKLNKTSVKLIRLLLDMGKGVCEIARLFKLNRHTISDIKLNKRWTHI